MSAILIEQGCFANFSLYVNGQQIIESSHPFYRFPASVQRAQPFQSIVYVAVRDNHCLRRELELAGAEVLPLGEGPGIDLPRLLDELGRRDVLNLLVEGGGKVLGSFFDAGLVDRVEAFVAPVVFGGASAPGPVAGTGLESLAQALSARRSRVTTAGADAHVTAILRTYGPRIADMVEV